MAKAITVRRYGHEGHRSGCAKEMIMQSSSASATSTAKPAPSTIATIIMSDWMYSDERSNVAGSRFEKGKVRDKCQKWWIRQKRPRKKNSSEEQ